MTLASEAMILGALCVAFGYVVGAIPFGVVVGSRRGVDVRDSGSGNIGATNVARTVGKGAGAFVLLLDAAKGALPLLAWMWLPGPRPSEWWLVAVGMAPIIGHCFSPWLGFTGGKGVATALGVFVAVAPLSGLVAIGTFAVVYAAFRVASLGSLVAAAMIAVYIGVFRESRPELALAIAAAVLIVTRHRGNLARLIRRAELRV